MVVDDDMLISRWKDININKLIGNSLFMLNGVL
jgi:hypothetical protein